jgi:antitoxin component HigA of HigAB toxin-antitoxin module
MFVADVAALEWEVLRWRRLKSSLMRMRGLRELKDFLLGHLPYDHYREYVEKDLLEVLREEYQDQSEAQRVARGCVDHDPNDVRRVEMILENCELDLTELRIDAHTRKAEELAQDYARRQPDAIKLIDELLGKAGSSIDALMVTAISQDMDKIDRFNRLAAIAETRRNAALREIDRRRAPLGQGLRRQVQEVEADYKVIETTPAEAPSVA